MYWVDLNIIGISLVYGLIQSSMINFYIKEIKIYNSIMRYYGVYFKFVNLRSKHMKFIYITSKIARRK